MKKSYYFAIGLLIIVLAGASYFYAMRQDQKTQKNGGSQETEQAVPQKRMTFFVTSANPGKGADLGGLAGADNYCQSLAEASGADGRIWRAYLSTAATSGQPTVNARDRIGNGPWQNAKGVVIAKDLEELHGSNSISKTTALTEKGDTVKGRGDEPNQHDILTGSTSDGRAIATSTDTTCSNWTSSDRGSAMVGHHDLIGLRDDDASRSWNSSHMSRGCSNEALASSGGGGLFYCFALTE